MTPHRSLLLASSLAFTACAGQTYNAHAGPMWARARGEIAVQNAGGTLVLGDNQNSLQSDMGLGDSEVSPYVRLGTDIDRHRVRVHGFLLDTEGTGTLSGDYGGILAGTDVETSMDFWSIAGSYAYQFHRGEHLRFAAGVQLGYYALDVKARAIAGGFGREETVTDTLVPMPYVEAEAFLGPVTVGANFGAMAADLGDANGRYWDFEGYARLGLGERFDVTGGYRYVLLDGYGNASERDFDADIDVQGLFVSAGVRF